MKIPIDLWTIPEHFSGRADQGPTRKISAQAWPGPTGGPEILAQARPIIRKACRASGRVASLNSVK
jgi:hypothetical protein